MYYYNNHCWNCGSEVNSNNNVQCRSCHWYICNTCYSCKEGCIGQENELLVKGFKAFTSYKIIPKDNQLDNYTIIFHKIEKTNEALNKIKQSGLKFNFKVRESENFVLDRSLNVEQYIYDANKIIEFAEILHPTDILNEIDIKCKFQKFKIYPIEYFYEKNQDEIKQYLISSKRMQGIYKEVEKPNKIMKTIIEKNSNINFTILSVETLFYMNNVEIKKYINKLKVFINNFNIYNSKAKEINTKLEEYKRKSVNFTYEEKTGSYFLDKNKSEFQKYIHNAKLIINIEDEIKNRNSLIYFKYPELKNYLRNAQSFVAEDKYDIEEINKEVNKYMTMLYKLMKE